MALDLAIVIPVGPGDEAWRVLLPQLAAWPVREIVVVFANDHLPTDPRPERLDTRVHVALAPRGRALQLNAGASATTARWLWFLHADSVLTATAASAMARHLDRDESDLGFFDLRFLNDGPALMAINSFGAWFRSRWLGIPFGDQGFVMSRALFDRLGGFDAAVEFGEDHDLIWRARAAGATIRPVGAALFTSARKYAERGWLRTTAMHLHATWRQARTFSRRAMP
jgi:Glycosyl transferase family 2